MYKLVLCWREVHGVASCGDSPYYSPSRLVGSWLCPPKPVPTCARKAQEGLGLPPKGESKAEEKAWVDAKAQDVARLPTPRDARLVGTVRRE